MPNLETFKSDVYEYIDGKLQPNGSQVDSTYLIDSSGNYIRDPSTGNPYIVPVGYNPQDTINKFVGFDTTNDAIYSLLKYNTGGEYDLQRSFNGNSFGGFVKARGKALSETPILAITQTGLFRPTFLHL